MRRSKAITAGLVAGLVAGIAMTVIMLIVAWFGVATPLAIIGDRLSVFIPPGPFLKIMGTVGGYNHLKQLGVGSTMAGQLVVGALGGAIYGLIVRRDPARRTTPLTIAIFIILPVVAAAVVLWPVLGTSYRGLPIDVARLVTLINFALCVFIFERVMVVGFKSLTSGSGIGFQPMSNQEHGQDAHAKSEEEEHGQDAHATTEFTPAIGRRSFLLGGVGLALAGGGAAMLRKLWQTATFSYDGTQYKGKIVESITPNELFYCVTKNVIDPKVNISLWHLEIGGLVRNPATWRASDLKGFQPVEQETTLMCISNGLDAGLMSNARWTGIPLRDLLDQAGPLAGAGKVKLHGVDNYTDTIPLEKAMEPTTLLAYQMNGAELSDRHGYPLRVIVPGYFGEKHVKWLTRIELVPADAKGFYEAQGWGPDFITPTRSRIDVPDYGAQFSLSKMTGPIEVRGIAYGGDRGITKVELSLDDGESWRETEIYYSGGKLAWSLWRATWIADQPGDFTLVARATDGKGEVQKYDESRGYFSGTTGFHQIAVKIVA